MITIILSHEVKDFSDWKTMFEADESRRAEMGVKLAGLFNAVDNPNAVTMIFEFPSVEAFQGFMADPDLKNKMEKAGVLTEPQVKVLNRV